MNIDFKKLSPMMKQYFEIKNSVRDALLLYRLGDFYEMFYDDAVIGSRELELVLTGRDCGQEERAPMCGVPYHAVNSYVARLVEKGYKVAICEQTEDPALAKGIVKRDIIRIITPGTVSEASMLADDQNNYIASVFLCEKGFGVCFADVSTGVVHITENGPRTDLLINELTRFSPREIIFNPSAGANPAFSGFLASFSCAKNQLYDSYFEPDIAKAHIFEQFDPAAQRAAAGFSAGFAVRALGALVKYVKETQKSGAARLVDVVPYGCEQYMTITPSAVRNLELFETMRLHDKRGSLLWVLDSTETAMGKRLLRAFLEKPLLDTALINTRLDATEELFSDSVLLSKTKKALDGIFDLERLMTRIVYGNCGPRDLVSLAQTSEKLSELKAISGSFKSAYLAAVDSQLDTLDDIRADISAAVKDDPPALTRDGGYIKPLFNSQVDEYRDIVSGGKGYLATIETRLREETGIKQLKIGYNRVFGYYIEVSKSNTGAVPDTFIRKQTLTTGERYITEELKQLEDKILGAHDRLIALEKQLFDELAKSVADRLKRVQRTASAVARLDVACSFADISLRGNYCRPTVNDTDTIEILNGRHPVVEKVQTSSLFVPNDCLLDGGSNMVSIITGPNMAGKSTYMRMTALTVIMAQMGCFVPARSASIGVVDKVFTRVGASDDLYSGQSTFMTEMNEVAEILDEATPKSLLILDEVGRGTSTFDGMSIARAVLEYICEHVKAKTMFATHFHEITDIEREYDCVKNYNITAKKRGDEITFLRRVVRGRADDSYGIEVAKLAGLPGCVIERAKEILKGLENNEAPVRQQSPEITECTEPEKDAARLLRSLSLESLTPIEAMYKLNDAIKILERDDD